MAKLNSFTFISLNGFYKGESDDISWHLHGEEEASYSQESLKSGNTLLFGRVTYEMMKSFWPTQLAFVSFPEIAEKMNKANKVVVSGSLKSADWDNTKIISNNVIDNISRLKKESKNGITLLGSGTLLKQLSEANLVDEYQLMLDPIFIEKGQPVINNISRHIPLRLTKSKVFRSGIILLCYEPASPFS